MGDNLLIYLGSFCCLAPSGVIVRRIFDLKLRASLTPHIPRHVLRDRAASAFHFAKSPRSHRAIRRLEQFYLALKNQEDIKGKGGSR